MAKVISTVKPIDQKLDEINKNEDLIEVDKDEDKNEDKHKDEVKETPTQVENLDYHPISLKSVIDFLEKKMLKFELSRARNIILVFGNAGVGKRTFIQFVGNDDRTILTSHRWDAIDFIIENKNRLDNNVFPALIEDWITDNAYYVCPAFDDIRNAEEDLAVTYFLKRVIAQAKLVKLVFLISFFSVKSGVLQSEMVSLLQNAVRVVKNIENFKQSIVLVVTKIDMPVSENIIFDIIAMSLNDAKSSIKDFCNKDDITCYQEEKLLDFFLEKQDGIYKNIAIFQKPNEIGPLQAIQSLQKNKRDFLQILQTRLLYHSVEKNDFSYGVLENTLTYVKQICTMINDHIVKVLNNIRLEIENHYYDFEKKNHGLETLQTMFVKDFYAFSNMAKLLKENTSYKELVQLLMYVLTILKITISGANLQELIDECEKLIFFQSIGKLDLIKFGAYPIEWIKNFKQFLKYLGNSKLAYEFFGKLLNRLSEYKVRKRLLDAYDPEIESLDSVIEKNLNITLYESNLNKLLHSVRINQQGYNTGYDTVKYVSLNRPKFIILKKILVSALKSNVTISCPNNPNRLEIKGESIKLTDVVMNRTYEGCSTNIKFVTILALNRIYFDTTFKMKGNNLQLYIFAPIWIFTNGVRMIQLEGNNGETHKNKQAQPGTLSGEKGDDGLMGLRGAAGGHIVGIGRQFVSDKVVYISVNGGNGGPGQTGGMGSKGRPGKDAYCPTSKNENYEEIWRKENFQVKKYVVSTSLAKNKKVEVIDYTIFGTLGEVGGAGGDGGMGGSVGKDGTIFIISLEKSSKIRGIMDHNQPGDIGLGGPGGQGGANGDGFHVRCNVTSTKSHYILTDIVENVTFDCLNNITKFLNGNANNGLPGLNGVSTLTTNITPEKMNTSLVIATVINEYKEYVQNSIEGNVDDKYLLQYLELLEKNSEVSDLYTTLDLIHTFDRIQKSTQTSNTISNLSHKSLFASIQNKAETIKENKDFVTQKTILNYLYTVGLSNNCLKHNTWNNRKVETNKYLNITMIKMETFKMQNFTSIVKQYIQDVRFNLNKTESDNSTRDISSQLQNNVANLYIKLDLLLNKPVKTQTEQEDERKHLGNYLISVMLYNSLNLVVNFFLFLNSLEMHTLNAIKGKFPVFPNLAFKLENSNVTKLTVFSNTIAASVNSAKEQLIQSEKGLLIEQFKICLDAVNGNYQNDSFTSELRLHIIESEKKLLQIRHINSQALTDVYFLRDDLLRLFAKDEKNNQANNILTYIQHILNIRHVSPTFFESLLNNPEKIVKLSNATKSIMEDIRVLENFENDILTLAYEVFENLEISMQKLSTKISLSLQATIEIDEWNVQETVKTLKIKLQQMRKPYKVTEDYSVLDNQLANIISRMVSTYNDLQYFSIRVLLAAYLENILSDDIQSVKKNKDALNINQQKMQKIIIVNVIIDYYNSALHALQQSRFPFAESYKPEFDLAFEETSNKTVGDLISKAVSKLKKLQNIPNKTTASLTTRDRTLIGLTKFFTWKNSEYRDTISQLLNGKQITITADVTKGIKKNSVKFSVIRIDFKSTKDNISEAKLQKVLKNFRINIIHLGLSYYRCKKSFYVILNENRNITHEFNEKNQTVIDDVVDINNMISPYGTWSLQLVNKESKNFSSLEEFKGQVDLELLGREKGEVDSKSCTENLNLYYMKDSISEANSVTFNNVRSLDDLIHDDKFCTESLCVPSKVNVFKKRRSIERIKENVSTKADNGSRSPGIFERFMSFINPLNYCSSTENSIKKFEETPFGFTKLTTPGPYSLHHTINAVTLADFMIRSYKTKKRNINSLYNNNEDMFISNEAQKLAYRYYYNRMK